MYYSTIFSIVFSALAFIAGIVATFTPAWLQLTVKNISGSAGHIHLCVEGRCFEQPISILTTPSDVASFVFMVISVALLLVALILLSVGAARENNKMLQTGGAIELSGGVSAVIGATIFAVQAATDFEIRQAGTFGYSFALAWVAAGLAIITGIVALISKSESFPKVTFIKV